MTMMRLENEVGAAKPFLIGLDLGSTREEVGEAKPFLIRLVPGIHPSQGL